MNRPDYTKIRAFSAMKLISASLVLGGIYPIHAAHASLAANEAVYPQDLWGMNAGTEPGNCVNDDSTWGNPPPDADLQPDGPPVPMRIPCIRKGQSADRAVYSCSVGPDPVRMTTGFLRTRWAQGSPATSSGSDPLSVCSCSDAGTPMGQFDAAASKTKLQQFLSNMSTTYGSQQNMTIPGYPTLSQPISNEGMASFFQEYIHNDIKQTRVSPTGTLADSTDNFAQINWNAMVASSPAAGRPDNLNYCIYFVRILMTQIVARHDELAGSAGRLSQGSDFSRTKLGIYLSPPTRSPNTAGSPPSGDRKVIPIPDPRLPFSNAKLLKRDDGTAYDPTPDKYNEAVRDFIAEQFDRMVRIYVAGSDQLNIDKKTKFQATKPNGARLRIRGIYQGYTPNLLDAFPPVEFPYKIGGTETCTPGANHGISNLENRWFAETPGALPQREVTNSSGWKNHVCKNALVPHPNRKTRTFPMNSGLLIQQIMMLAENIKNQQIKAGILLPQTDYWTSPQPPAPPAGRGRWAINTQKPIGINDADRMRQEIAVRRNEVLKMWQDYSAGFKDAATGKIVAVKPCAEQLNMGKDTALTEGTTGTQLQGHLAGACLISAMQNRIEIDMVVRLAFYQWAYVAKSIMSRGNRYLLETIAANPSYDDYAATLAEFDAIEASLRRTSRVSQAKMKTENQNRTETETATETETPRSPSPVSPIPGILLGAGLLSRSRRSGRVLAKGRRSLKSLLQLAGLIVALQPFITPSAEAACSGRKKDRPTQCDNQNYNVDNTDICTASFNSNFKPAFDELLARLNQEAGAAAGDQDKAAAIQERILQLNESKDNVIEDCRSRQFMAYTRYKMKWFLPKCKKIPEYDNVEEAERLCQIDSTGFDADSPGTSGSPTTAIDQDIDKFNPLNDSGGEEERTTLGDGDFVPLRTLGKNDATGGAQRTGATAGGTYDPNRDGARAGGSGNGDSGNGLLGSLMKALNGGSGGGLGEGSGGGSGGSSGGTGGGTLGLSGSGTAAGSKGSSDAAGGHADGGIAKSADGDSAYSKGGARSPAGASEGDGGGMFGAGGLLGALMGDKSGSGSGNASSANEISFGKDANGGADGAHGALGARGSEDPSDYFARIGRDENIFKKVERRYGEKAMNWYVETARGK